MRSVLKVLDTLLVELGQDAAAVHLVTTRRAPRAQRRTDDPATLGLLDRAVAMHQETAVPFWDSVFLIAESDPSGLPSELARAAALHQTPVSDEIIEIGPTFMSAVERRLSTAEEDEIVCLSSKVLTHSGAEMHIPMLDFAARNGAAGSLQASRQVLNSLQVFGALLDSGRSYHFYGRRLMNSDQLRNFLGRSLLFAPLTDARWIAHQLISGSCALRISTGKGGLPPVEV